MGGQNSLLAFLFLFLLTLLPCKGWADSWTDPSGSGLVLEYTDVDGGVSITKITNAPYTLIIPSKIGEKSVVAIGTSAYSENTNVSLVLPASIKNIDNNAFADDKLSDVTMEASTPCTLGTSAFGVQSYFKIYVPSGSKAAYSDATGWSDYADNLEELITDETGNLKFKEYRQGELYLVGFVAGKSAENITIPATITVNGQELPVTNIYSSAFTSQNISSVTFAKDSRLKVIDQGAFGQTSLTKITIPASVTNMGAMAFAGCTSLTTVIMESATPCALTLAPFRGCSSDLKIYVPVGTVETYKSNSDWSDYENQIFEMPTPPITDATGTLLFEKNTAGDGLILKGFADDKSEANITIPATVDVDGDGDELPVTAIADDAFINNATLTSVSIPASVKTIGADAFHTCSNLTSIVIDGEGLQELGQFAFAGTGITSIVLPSSLTKTDQYTLSACASLKNVMFKATDITSYEGNNTFTGSGNIEHIYVPYEALDDYQNKFEKNKSKVVASTLKDGGLTYEVNDDLSSVTCTGLSSGNFTATSISIPVSVQGLDVTVIGKRAFENKSGLTSVSFAEGSQLKTISDWAFGHTGITSVKIPASVTKINSSAFSEAKLTELIFENGESLDIGSAAFSYTLISEVTLPESVKSIGNQAFCDTQISEISIPKSVQSIGADAFAYCPNLASVIVESETPCELGDMAFDKAEAPSTTDFRITVPKGKSDTYKAAAGWSAYEQYISESTAGSTITDGNYTYELNGDGDNTVTLVKFTATDAYSENVNVPATFVKDDKTYTVTQIGNGETINDSKYYNDAVANAIPNTVTKIGAHAFDRIRFVNGVIIPASVKSIGDAAFVTSSDDYSTSSVYNSVTLKASEAFTVGEKIFGETSNLSEAHFCILTSSEEVANNFKQTSGWDTYKDYFITEIVKNGLRYRKNGDGTALTLMGFDEESTDAKNKVVVPAEVDGIPVTAIASKAFMSQSNLVSLDLSQAINLTQIGESAFGETGLKEVVIPAQVKTLGYLAFGNISSLTKATFERESDFGEDVDYAAAFLGSNNLAEIYVPKGTKSIYTNLFENSIENAEETIKEIVKPISDGTYKYQLNDDGQTVTVVGIADGVTLKNEVWVQGSVESYEVTGIAANVFSNMPEISQIHIPSCVSKIDANAFTGMKTGLKVYFDRTDNISEYSKDMFGTTEVSSINVPTEAYAAYYEQLTNAQEDENKIGVSSSLTDGQGVNNLAQGLYPVGELKYTRTITEDEKGGYITTCLPFQINLSDAKYGGLFAGVWTFTPQVTYKADGRYYIDLQKIEGGTVAAGTPMLLKLNADVEEVSFYNAEALKNDGDLDVQPTDASVTGKTDVTIQYSGTYIEKRDCESVYSFNVDATFGKHNGSTLNPFRAYLTIVDASGNAVQNASFYSSLNPGGNTTGIDGVAADTVGTKAAIYSIDGKLVRKAGDSKRLAKGVYIIGGKKLVVK